MDNCVLYSLFLIFEACNRNLVNHNPLQTIELENEMLGGRHSNGSLRSVSTVDRIDLPSGPADDDVVLVKV